ncbi:MAG: hypothetical protein N2117_01380 [Anaerolineales bacterium]|nr:hypothetical protein [Anaerolineales bacterium]MDW8276838.1 hypothetical protein [Anaerolineales bacterium]
MTEVTYCTYHPSVETTLRCRRCEKYICTKCAVRTPTGYICKECSRAQQKAFETAETIDYLLGFAAAVVLSLIGSFLIMLIGFVGFFGLILVSLAAPTAGILIAEALRFVTRRRRSALLFRVILAGLIVGALPMGLIQIFTLNVFGILFQAIYLFISAPTAYYRLSGIQLFK